MSIHRFHLCHMKDEHRTSNDYFFSAVLILVTKILINFSVSCKISSNSSGLLINGTRWISFNHLWVSLFPIQRWVLDVRCSMFNFFKVRSRQKNLTLIPCTSHHRRKHLVKGFSPGRNVTLPREKPVQGGNNWPAGTNLLFPVAQ